MRNWHRLLRKRCFMMLSAHNHHWWSYSRVVQLWLKETSWTRWVELSNWRLITQYLVANYWFSIRERYSNTTKVINNYVFWQHWFVAYAKKLWTRRQHCQRHEKTNTLDPLRYSCWEGSFVHSECSVFCNRKVNVSRVRIHSVANNHASTTNDHNIMITSLGVA